MDWEMNEKKRNRKEKKKEEEEEKEKKKEEKEDGRRMRIISYANIHDVSFLFSLLLCVFPDSGAELQNERLITSYIHHIHITYRDVFTTVFIYLFI